MFHIHLILGASRVGGGGEGCCGEGVRGGIREGGGKIEEKEKREREEKSLEKQ